MMQQLCQGTHLDWEPLCNGTKTTSHTPLLVTPVTRAEPLQHSYTFSLKMVTTLEHISQAWQRQPPIGVLSVQKSK